MESTDELRLAARTTVLQHLVRLLYFERARARGDTPTDVMIMAELAKQFFETTMGEGPGAAYIAGEIDAFFNVLAQDLKNAGENP